MDASEAEIREMISKEFIQKVILRFREMYADISEIY